MATKNAKNTANIAASKTSARYFDTYIAKTGQRPQDCDLLCDTLFNVFTREFVDCYSMSFDDMRKVRLMHRQATLSKQWSVAFAIEDVLEDINYHQLCCLLSLGKYDEAEAFIGKWERDEI